MLRLAFEPYVGAKRGSYAAAGATAFEATVVLAEELQGGVDAAFEAGESSSGDAYVRLKRTSGPITLRSLSPRSGESSATSRI